MTRKQGYGRQSANVPAGDYRGYKRAIEERRRNMDNDSARYADYADERDYAGDESTASEQDEVSAAAASAYAQTASGDSELNAALGVEEAAEFADEDEESMPAPRRRARAYRSGQSAPADAVEAEHDEPLAEPNEKEAAVEEEIPAPVREKRQSRPHADRHAPRPAKAARRPHQPRRDIEVAHEETDDLEDYCGDDTAYSYDVYEPYEYEDDADSEDAGEENASEWADGIKRAFNKGRAGFMALRAKANSGGKKRPPAKKKRPAQRKPSHEHARPEYLDEAAQQDAAPVYEPLDEQPVRRVQPDTSDYESVSEELEAIEEIRPVSRRERRMMQEKQETSADEYPQVNIVSRKAMRAQQEERAAVDAAQPVEEQPDSQQTSEAMDGAAEAMAKAVEVMPEAAEAPQPEEQPEEPAQPEETGDSGMMFGIQGRQHIMQPAREAEFNLSGRDWEEPAFEEAPQDEFSEDDLGRQESADEEPEAEPEQEKGRGRKKPGRRERKERKAARRRDFDLDDDDDDYPVQPAMDDTAKYRKAPVSRDVYIGDDDDEPEDDFMRASESDAGFDDDDQVGFIAPDNDFADESYADDSFAGEDDEGDYEEDDDEDEGGRGGCLKAFTIFLVIMLVLFGSVWALDYFGVISVRDIAGRVTSMSIFDPLRGNLLPAATEPESTPVPVTQDDAAPTIQPAAEGATQIPTITDAAATAAPTGAADTQQLSINSPETDSQANILPVQSNATSQPAPQQTFLAASPVEEAMPDSSRFDLEYGVYVDYERDREYSREEPITFGLGEDYTELEGVVSFRGNNFRENAAYGTASLAQKKLEVIWKNRIGSIDSGYAVWSGVGWNGQPVMVHWPDELRQMMNIRDEFKSDSDLIEVIYGTLDGNIYFLDSSTGDYTRDPIELGFPIKGSVSIDPRGYPLLYVGQGISKANGRTGSIGWRVYNLLNQEHMYLLNGHDELRFRTHGSFDGVCLLDAETDTIIEGAENGIFYTVKLNTVFDSSTPSITIDPEVTLYRYKSRLSREIGDDGLGIENSVAAYGQYAYFIDNSGLLTCIDLNSMSPAWLFDVGDDTDASISLEQQADGTVALYTINEVDKQGERGDCTMRKLNALTGEQLWSYSVECKSDGTNGGGGFASPALGKNSLSDIVYFNAARTDGGGTLYAFNKQTGEILWKKTTGRYSWSSPVLVYNEQGEGVVILGNSGGVLRMYDGLTGEVYDELEIDGNMEGSPAVYGDTLVIGTRDCKIYGIKIL